MSKEILKEPVGLWEVEELACKILGLDYDEIDADTSIIEDKLMEELNIDLDYFVEIISRLLPLVEVGESPLTDTLQKGFVDRENKVWLVRTRDRFKTKKYNYE